MAGDMIICSGDIIHGNRAAERLPGLWPDRREPPHEPSRAHRLFRAVSPLPLSSDECDRVTRARSQRVDPFNRAEGEPPGHILSVPFSIAVRIVETSTSPVLPFGVSGWASPGSPCRGEPRQVNQL